MHIVILKILIIQNFDISKFRYVIMNSIDFRFKILINLDFFDRINKIGNKISLF